MLTRRIAYYRIAHCLDGPKLTVGLGNTLAQLSDVIVDPYLDTPKDLARITLRYRINIRLLEEVVNAPLPPPETAD